jgi:twitching motility protein PilJ
MEKQNLNKRYLTMTTVFLFLTVILIVGAFYFGVSGKAQAGAFEIADFAPSLLLLVLALCTFAIINILWFRNSVIKPLKSVQDVMKSVKKGNYGDRIKITSKDEFGAIAGAFNDTLDRLSALAQTDDERRNMQGDIIRFLNILSAASEGDLSQKAEVTPDVF